MTETSTTSTITPGSVVRITAGAHADRIGTVVAASPVPGPVVDVVFETPILLSRPDGPTQLTQLPFAPGELEVIETDSIPAGRGKRRRLSVPVPANRDHASKAECRCQRSPEAPELMRSLRLVSMAACPAHNPATYAKYGAQHRIDGTAA